MTTPSSSTERVGRAARTGAAGTVVGAVAFFDGACIGMPIAALAAALRPLFVFPAGAVAVSLLAIACCTWLERRWGDWSSGNRNRLERRLGRMRESRLMRKPVAWLEHGSDRQYAFVAAVANPVLVAALARSIGGCPIGRRRIVLGAVAYAIPYVALWTLVGVAIGSAV
ncbi:MAG TPA: hypothetical protein VHS03_00850 [Gaiellaceae bacterium]|jgi:hypothetical protein|nr:hypothetical protein [Gaiellaceae bacterium]